MATTVQQQSIATELGELPLVVHLPPALALTDDQFFELACANEGVRLERNAQGDLLVMSPSGWESGDRESEAIMQLRQWAKRDGRGKAFGSSTGFRLPNGAVYAADACWVPLATWDALPAALRKKFAHLCPDFVIEIRSESDRLKVLQDKMQEYTACGAQLGWLIDPLQRRVYVYRPGVPVEELEGPDSLSGDPLLRGFVLDLREIW